MEYRLLILKVIFFFCVLLHASTIFAASEPLHVGGRVSLGNAEDDFSGKVYFNLPPSIRRLPLLKNITFLKPHRHVIWLEKGRIDLEQGLYRHYVGGLVRVFPKPYFGMGGYCYFDMIAQKRDGKKDSDLSTYMFNLSEGLNNDTEVCLIPHGGLWNTGIEIFSSYVNINMSAYGDLFQKGRSYAFSVPASIHEYSIERDCLIAANEKNFYLENKLAIEGNLWRRFSNIIVRAGGFYRWMDFYPGDPSAKEQRLTPEEKKSTKGQSRYTEAKAKEKQFTQNWGGCIEVGYFVHPLLKIGLKGSWDNWNKYSANFSVTFESLPKRITLYQPVQRYLMPIQYNENEQLSAPQKASLSSKKPNRQLSPAANRPNQKFWDRMNEAKTQGRVPLFS